MSQDLSNQPAVTSELDGWSLFWVELERVELSDQAAMDLGSLCQDTAERARTRFADQPIAKNPTAAAIRRLFRDAGCDPTRYRPSSEALIRRLLKGGELPAIHPLVDFNNCLSVELVAPACVLAAGSFSSPVVFRAGRAGESYDSLRGPFKLEGKPVLADAQGPFGTPITDSQRVKVGATTDHAWLVVYLPAEISREESADATLDRLLAKAPGICRVAR